ncbi:FlgO family outer membrane protein [Chromohalobacter sp. HP20-39]|uniref:FlgO family outer membrane protein n=1 Tax=Chromohalobacter sp. HP20-39 TaxID=3079306 RepID=UPI00294B131C|nr:FlgO family outer membrane protein [Chromohalobacter sp. HP20-39]MDV6317472.1 FlgO family outer membrane protein [Chromohalobacter sp. HP20-39]
MSSTQRRTERLTLRLLTLAILLLVLSGCSLLQNRQATTTEPSMLTRVDKAADELMSTASEHLGEQAPIIATTFVDVDQLDQSSTLGRTLSEMFTSQLVQGGMNVIEVKMRNSLYIEQNTGELILSRNVQRLSANHDAQAVLLGTYARGQNSLFVNARLVRIADRHVLGASSFEVPLNNDLRALLPSTW